jgi:hypothetical protein
MEYIVYNQCLNLEEEYIAKDQGFETLNLTLSLIDPEPMQGETWMTCHNQKKKSVVFNKVVMNCPRVQTEGK